MRTILFRGFHVDPNGDTELLINNSIQRGDWLYGDLVHNAMYACIIPEGAYSDFRNYLVIVDTVGEYTGIDDPNGKRIFEGDCVRHKFNNVEFMNGAWIVAGDRRLAGFNQSVVGTIFDR